MGAGIEEANVVTGNVPEVALDWEKFTGMTLERG